MELNTEQLSATLVDIIEATDLETALRLVECWGGVRVYVPHQLTEEHALVTTLGRRRAEKLAAAFAGESLVIPRCLHAVRAARNAQIRARRAEGATPAQLARQHSLTERQVYSIVARHENQDHQGDLFASVSSLAAHSTGEENQ